MPANHTLQPNGGGPSWLQSARLVAAVAELVPSRKPKTESEVLMRSLSLISLCLLLIGGSVRGQQAESAVRIKLNRPHQITSQAGATIQAAMIELLKTSNFNSKDHRDIFPDGVGSVHRKYRDTIGGQYLVVTFPKPRTFELIRGQVTAIEVIVGLNNTQYADTLFTIDPEGRVVEHSKFSGKVATELLELVNRERAGG